MTISNVTPHAGNPTGQDHNLAEQLALEALGGALAGAAAGALAGILFPPAVIGTAVAGAAVGGVGGHLWRGMSRSDVKESGELIDSGQAALVIVGESKLQEAVAKAGLKAGQHAAKGINVSKKDVDRAVQEAATEVR